MIKYLIDDKVFETEKEVLDYVLSEDDIDESGYDDELDEIYGEVEICGYTYSSSYALKEVDPTAYRCGLADWRSEKLDELQEELLDQLHDIPENDEGYVNDYYVKVVNDEPEEIDDDDDEDNESDDE